MHKHVSWVTHYIFQSFLLLKQLLTYIFCTLGMSFRLQFYLSSRCHKHSLLLSFSSKKVFVRPCMVPLLFITAAFCYHSVSLLLQSVLICSSPDLFSSILSISLVYQQFNLFLIHFIIFLNIIHYQILVNRTYRSFKNVITPLVKIKNPYQKRGWNIICKKLVCGLH